PRGLLKSLSVSLGSGHGRCQAKRGGPAATPSPGTVLCQDPCRVQTNLASPGPGLGLALKDTTGRLINSSFRQQSNLQPLAGRPHRKAPEFAVQQSNLSIRETSSAKCGSHASPHLWSEPQESFRPHMMAQGSPLPRGPLAHPPSSLRQSWWLASDTPCQGFRPAAGCVLLSGCTWPGPRSWGGLGSWTSRLTGEPLTLEDLAVPVQSQAQAPSQAAVCQLLASVRRLEHKAARLGCRASQEPSGPCRGRALAACPQPGLPVLASRDKRKKYPRGLRETEDSPETPGAQAGLSDSQASSKPASPEPTLGMLTGDVLDPEQGVLPAHPPGWGGNCSPETAFSSGWRGEPLLPRGAGSRGARLCSSAFSHAAWGVLPGREGGEGAPREQVSRKEERTASSPPDTAPARGARQVRPEESGSKVGGLQGAPLPPPRNSHSKLVVTTLWQLLSRCFRAWRGVVRRRQAVAAAVALGRRQLLRRGLRALRSALWLREAQLEVAWGRHTQALLARSFQKWRNLTQQEKRGQPHVQAGPGPPSSEGGQGRGLSGRKPAVDPAPRSSLPPVAPSEGMGQAGEGAPGRGLPGHTEDSEDGEVLSCCPGHPAPGSLALQRLVKRGARYRDHMANRRARTLRTCLQQWMQMKWLRASERAKVTQLSLCWQKAGNMALCSSAPGAATDHGLGVVAQAPGLPQELGRGSLQDACPRLALHPELLLWRTRLFQCQRADSFLQGMRRRILRRILRRWRWRAWGPGTPSGSSRTTWAPELLGGIPGGEASLDCSTPRSSLEKASRAPAPLESLRESFLLAAGRRQQGRCLLFWHARAQQSRGAASWHQSTLQRRHPKPLSAAEGRGGLGWPQVAVTILRVDTPLPSILLGWSHWATAQGAQRELAARWAWGQSCRAVLSLWRRRLVQQQDAEWWAQERGRRRVRDALHHWHSCWQRQQFLHEKYQRWVQVHLQGLRRATFWRWQQAAARRRRMVAGPEQHLLQSHFQAWCGGVRDTGTLRAKHRAFQDGLRRRALGAAFVTWQEARVAAARAREQHVARASIVHWRSSAQRGRAARQLRGAQAQQAFTAWRVALGQRREARQQAEERARAQARAALCWTLWVRESRLHRVSRTHTARKLSARGLGTVSGWGPCPESRHHPVPAGWAQAPPADPLGPVADSTAHSAAGTWGQGPGGQHGPPQAQGRPQALPHAGQQRAPPGADGCLGPAEAGEAGPRWGGRPKTDLRAGGLRISLFQPMVASMAGCFSRGPVALWTPPLPRSQTASWLWRTANSEPAAAGHRPQGPCCLAQASTTTSVDRGSGEKQPGLRVRRPAPGAGLVKCRGDREPPLCHAFQLWLQWPGHSSWAQGQLPTGPGEDCSSETGAPKGKGEANERRWGRKYLQRWHLEALLRRLQGTQQARHLAVTWQRWVDAQGAKQLARTLLRQWHLRWAWRTWRRQVLRLWVAQRLQQQDDSWVLSQAFEKWHQRLVARGPRRGDSSSLRPLSKLAIRSPGSRLEAARAPVCARPGAEQGPSCSCDCSHGKKNRN
ncbi:hypothetical protein HPG69_011982, partial [Diceros bicornis minor]